MISVGRNVAVVDRYDAHRDPSMPFLARALDPIEVEHEFAACLRKLEPGRNSLQLHSIQVARHKPGRRCLIEYQFAGDPPAGLNRLTVLGKVRSKSTDEVACRTTQALWEAGFNANAPDGIMVPEPIGIVPAFQMWLQRKVPGVVATKLLPSSGGIDLAHRVAVAASKLHQSRVPPGRCHTPDDEMRILRRRLAALAAERPDLSARLRLIQDACIELATELPTGVEHGIHRDFYPDQVLVDGSRLYLLDLDLYAAGDPALDIGNFVGHLIEQSLRELGSADRLRASAQALEERYVASGGEGMRRSIHVYTTLTLARHIHLSTQFDHRRHITEQLLNLCEDRLRTG